MSDSHSYLEDSDIELETFKKCTPTDETELCSFEMVSKIYL